MIRFVIWIGLGGDLPLGFLSQALLVVQRQNLSGHLDTGLDDQPSKFLTEFRLQAGQFGLIRMASFGNNVGGGGDRLLGFDLRNPCRCSSRFFNDPTGLGARFCQQILRFAMGNSELLPSAAGIGKTLSDGRTAVFQSLLDGTDRPFLQNERYQQKADRIGYERRNVGPEGLSNLGDRTGIGCSKN